MTTRPDFSPPVLAGFIRVRKRVASCSHTPLDAVPCQRCQNKVRDELRRAAGVTCAEMDMAMHGRLASAVPRDHLWRALGIVPADYRIRLLNGGKQEGINNGKIG